MKRNRKLSLKCRENCKEKPWFTLNNIDDAVITKLPPETDRDSGYAMSMLTGWWECLKAGVGSQAPQLTAQSVPGKH